jgi:hypothetical protein
MTPITCNVLDCTGFEVVTSLPWESDEDRSDDQADRRQPLTPGGWGFMVCKAFTSPTSVADSSAADLYGVVGEQVPTGRIERPCLGIPLEGTPDPRIALSRFALACGLSVIGKANLELGDTAVIAGANPLALSVSVAASQQGARTVCVAPAAECDSSYRSFMEQVTEASIVFTFRPSFDADFDAFVTSSRGKVVYIDTIGLPSIVDFMASRLRRFGTLILCRQDSTAMAQLDILHDIHRKSAQVVYWTRPESLEQALGLADCYRRATSLFRWKRVSQFAAVAAGEHGEFSGSGAKITVPER